MFRATTLTRAFSVRSVAARRTLLRDQDACAAQYVQTKRFVSGLEKAENLGQLQAALSGCDLSALDPKHASLVAYKIGQLHQHAFNVDDDALKPVAVNLVERNMDSFSVASIAAILMSLKNWRWPYPNEWPNRLTKRLFSHPRLTYKSLSRAIPVLVDLGIQDDQIWSDAIALVERQLPFLDQLAVAQCVHGISRAKKGDVKFYDKIVSYMHDRAFSLDPSILSRMSLSLAKAKDRTPDLFNLFDRLSQQVVRQLPLYSEKDLRMVISAFGAVVPDNKTLFTAIADQICLQPGNYKDSIAIFQKQFRQVKFDHNGLFRL